MVAFTTTVSLHSGCCEFRFPAIREFQHPRQIAGVHGSPAIADHGVELLGDHRGGWERHAQFGNHGEDHREILLVQARFDAGAPVTVGDLGAHEIEHLGAGEARGERLHDLLDFHAFLARKGERLGNRLDRNHLDDLVAGLGHLACAVVANVDDPLAQDVQDRHHLVQHARLAAHHDRKGAVLGAPHAA